MRSYLRLEKAWQKHVINSLSARIDINHLYYNKSILFILVQALITNQFKKGTETGAALSQRITKSGFFVKTCFPSIKRTVPDLARITKDWVDPAEPL